MLITFFEKYFAFYTKSAFVLLKGKKQAIGA